MKVMKAMIEMDEINEYILSYGKGDYEKGLYVLANMHQDLIECMLTIIGINRKKDMFDMEKIILIQKKIHQTLSNTY